MKLSEDRVKHLEFIHNTITRQAQHSFAVKGWSITVSTAIFAFVLTSLDGRIALLALLPIIAFAGLDLFYLRLERLFRELYKEAASHSSTLSPFDMSIGKYKCAGDYPDCTFRNVARSPSWWLLNGTLLIFGAIVLWVATAEDPVAEDLSQIVSQFF